MNAILPDCSRCGGRVVLDLDAAGPVEVCTSCDLAQRPVPPKVDRLEVRAQVREVRRTRPMLCPSCLRRSCRTCQVVTCECPGAGHPRRPAGDLTPEGMALLAAERQGHLEVGDLIGGLR